MKIRNISYLTRILLVIGLAIDLTLKRYDYVVIFGVLLLSDLVLARLIRKYVK